MDFIPQARDCRKRSAFSLVERAKGFLIKSQRFTEDQAYHTLRELAMDRNIAIAEMAKNVISMAELLG